MASDVRERRELRPPLGSCDWGGCDEPGYGEAYSDTHGWLPVCWTHYCAALTDRHRVRHYEPCICGGYSERFPDSERPCTCYSDRNPDCTCVVNPGGQDGVLLGFDCPVHRSARVSGDGA